MAQSDYEKFFSLTEVDVSQKTPESNLEIFVGLENKSLNPDYGLIQLIANLQNKDAIIPFALFLKGGADSNVYVDVPGVGLVHILVFMYMVKSAPVDVLNTLVAMLYYSGTDWGLPAFQVDETISVEKWFQREKIVTVIPFLKEDKINPKVSNEIGILLEREKMVTDINYNLAIMSFSNSFLDKYLVAPVETIDQPLMVTSINFLNYVAFDKLMNLGLTPSYLLMNTLILKLRTYRDQIIPKEAVLKMILSAVSRGVSLDIEQMNIISMSGEDVAVSTVYNQPKWKKECKAKEISPETWDLAYSFDIRSNSKERICQELNLLYQSDPKAVIRGAINRQQHKMNADLGTIREFEESCGPNLHCQNRDSLGVNPLEYSDLDVSYYRDEDGRVWCYNSTMYENLIRFRVNTYTGKRLPEDFVAMVQTKLNLIREIRGSVGEPVTISQAVKRLHQVDTINNRQNEVLLREFKEVAQVYGVDKLEILTPEQLTEILTRIGFPYNLTELSPNHAFISFSYIIMFLIRKDPKNAPKIFEIMKK